MSIAAVVLAAGASRRLGHPKQQVVLAGETLLARAIRAAREAGLSPIFVVTRDLAVAEDGVCVVANKAADEGIASSIRCGVAAAAQNQVTGAVILACDQPGISSSHVRALVADPGRLTGSAYAETSGIPAYFPAQFFSSLLELRGDTGARPLLKAAHLIRADELELDIDTEDDLRAARQLLEPRLKD